MPRILPHFLPVLLVVMPFAGCLDGGTPPLDPVRLDHTPFAVTLGQFPMRDSTWVWQDNTPPLMGPDGKMHETRGFASEPPGWTVIVDRVTLEAFGVMENGRSLRLFTHDFAGLQEALPFALLRIVGANPEIGERISINVAGFPLGLYRLDSDSWKVVSENGSPEHRTYGVWRLETQESFAVPVRVTQGSLTSTTPDIGTNFPAVWEMTLVGEAKLPSVSHEPRNSSTATVFQRVADLEWGLSGSFPPNSTPRMPMRLEVAKSWAQNSNQQVADFFASHTEARLSKALYYEDVVRTENNSVVLLATHWNLTFGDREAGIQFQVTWENPVVPRGLGLERYSVGWVAPMPSLDPAHYPAREMVAVDSFYAICATLAPKVVMAFEDGGREVDLDIAGQPAAPGATILGCQGRVLQAVTGMYAFVGF